MAYHEAGHAVVAWYYGFGCTAPIRPGDDNVRRHFSTMLLRRLRPGVELTVNDREQLEAHVRCVLAGGIAQRKSDPQTYDRAVDGSDRRMAVELLYWLAETEQELTAYWQLLAIQTHDLLNRASIWPLVEAVASKLVEQEELNGPDCEDVIRAGVKQLKSGQP
jgi:hypothetical protein